MRDERAQVAGQRGDARLDQRTDAVGQLEHVGAGRAFEDEGDPGLALEAVLPLRRRRPPPHRRDVVEAYAPPEAGQGQGAQRVEGVDPCVDHDLEPPLGDVGVTGVPGPQGVEHEVDDRRALQPEAAQGVGVELYRQQLAPPAEHRDPCDALDRDEPLLELVADHPPQRLGRQGAGEEDGQERLLAQLGRHVGDQPRRAGADRPVSFDRAQRVAQGEPADVKAGIGLEEHLHDGLAPLGAGGHAAHAGEPRGGGLDPRGHRRLQHRRRRARPRQTDVDPRIGEIRHQLDRRLRGVEDREYPQGETGHADGDRMVRRPAHQRLQHRAASSAGAGASSS